MKKVKSREKFRVKAETWNSFIDAAEFVKQRQADMKSQTGQRDTKSGTVMLRNDTDAALEQFTVVSIGNLIITPADNEPEFRQSMPVFEAVPLSDSNKDKPFAVLQKPLAKKECGIALVAGITPVKINVSSESHEYAEASAAGLKSSDSGAVRILWKESGTGEKWAIANLGSASPGQSGKSVIPAVIKSGTTLEGYLVDFYVNGFENNRTAENQPCHVLDLAAYDNIPAGERVMAIPLTVTETGDGE